MGKLRPSYHTSADFRLSQVSNGFTYSWSASAPVGNKVDIASIKINGEPIDPKGTYRVTINSFLTDGGDNFADARHQSPRWCARRGRAGSVLQGWQRACARSAEPHQSHSVKSFRPRRKQAGRFSVSLSSYRLSICRITLCTAD